MLPSLPPHKSTLRSRAGGGESGGGEGAATVSALDDHLPA